MLTAMIGITDLQQQRICKVDQDVYLATKKDVVIVFSPRSQVEMTPPPKGLRQQRVGYRGKATPHFCPSNFKYRHKDNPAVGRVIKDGIKYGACDDEEG
jgi:hypothetical protein